MPKIPQSPGQRVQEAPLQKPAQPSVSPKFGGGLASKQVQGAVQDLGGQGIQLLEEAKRRGDKASLIEADTKLTEWTRDRFYNKETGVLYQEGKKALELSEPEEEAYKEFADKVREDMANEEQRLAYDQMSASHGKRFNDSVQKHVFGETRKFEVATADASILNNGEDAAVRATNGDLDGIKIAMAKQKAVLLGKANLLGWDEKILEAQTLAVTSKTHYAVIGTFLNAKKTGVAKTYFNENKGEINSADREKIKEALKQSGKAEQGQADVERAIAQGLGEKATRAWIRKNFSGEREDEAISRYKIRVREIDAEKKKTLAAQHVDIRNKLEAAKLRNPNQSIQDVIGPATWITLTPERKNSYIKFWNGVETTNRKKYRELYSLAPEQIATLTEQQLFNRYTQHFKKEDHDKALHMWRDLTVGKKNTFLGIQSQDDILHNALVDAGLDPDDSDNNDRVNLFYDKVERNIIQAVSNSPTGQRPNNVQIKEMAEKMLTEFIVNKNTFWFNVEKKAFEIEAGDLSHADMDILDRARIVEYLRSNGFKVSDQNILNRFKNEQKLRVRKELEENK